MKSSGMRGPKLEGRNPKENRGPKSLKIDNEFVFFGVSFPSLRIPASSSLAWARGVVWLMTGGRVASALTCQKPAVRPGAAAGRHQGFFSGQRRCHIRADAIQLFPHRRQKRRKLLLDYYRAVGR